MSNAREFSIEVVSRLREAGFAALWAGGCVRDLLLDRTPGDYDVATDALPDDVRKVFGKRRTLGVGASFGVMIVIGNKSQGQVEVATFRSDGEYLDGRRPSSVSFSSPEHDAQRRDFTVNGMFYDPLAEEVIDYVGGRQDLSARVIRAIGDARQRFAEDKLRLLRAVRFAATLGFELEPETETAVCEMAPQISVVSVERIAQELRKMLLHANRARAIELAAQTGLLAEVLPELANAAEAQRVVGSLEQPSFELGLAALLLGLRSGVARGVCRRLRLSNKEIDAVGWLLEHSTALRDAHSFSAARLKRLLVQPLARDLIALLRARALDTDSQDASFCEHYLDTTPSDELNPIPLLTGDDLVSEGFSPGPHFKRILDAVRDAQLNGEITTPDQALARARELENP